TAPLNILVNWVPQWMRNAEEYRELGRECFGWFAVLLALNLISAAFAAMLVIGAFQKIKSAISAAPVGKPALRRSPRETFSRSPGILFQAVVLLVPLFLALISGKP